MYLGAKFEKSFAGLIMFAAMLTLIVATDIPNNANIAIITLRTGLPIKGASNPDGGVDDVICDRMYTGSQSISYSAFGRIYCEALVIMTPIAEKTIMVVGSPSTYPSIYSLWPLPNLVKSGMMRVRVHQNPIIPVRDGTKTYQNSPTELNFEGYERIGPIPPAFATTHIKRARAIINTSGAA